MDIHIPYTHAHIGRRNNKREQRQQQQQQQQRHSTVIRYSFIYFLSYIFCFLYFKRYILFVFFLYCCRRHLECGARKRHIIPDCVCVCARADNAVRHIRYCCRRIGGRMRLDVWNCFVSVCFLCIRRRIIVIRRESILESVSAGCIAYLLA